MTLRAAHLHWRAARRPKVRLPEWLIAPALVLLAVLALLGMVFGIRGLEPMPLLLGWALVGLVSFQLQTQTLTARRRERESGLRRDRERDAARRGEQTQLLEVERCTLRAVIGTSPVGLLVLDRESRVLLMNYAAARHFEVDDPEFWVGTQVVELIEHFFDSPVDSLPELRESLHAIEGDPKAALRDFEIGPGGATGRRLVLCSSAITTNRGEPLGYVWVIRDVTEERRLETELHQARQMGTLGALADGVAHDFNDQLTTILENTHRLLDRADLDEVGRRCLADLDQAALHCTQLTRGLLTFVRKAPQKPEPVDMANALAEVGDLLRAAIPRSVRLETRAARRVDPALVDPTQLQQMVLHLVVTAGNAMGGTGTIRLTARRRSIDDAGAAAHPERHPGRYVEIAVEDTGPGMDTPIDAEAADTSPGVTVVRGLARTQGGWIEFDSEPGLGNSYRILLPAAPVAPSAWRQLNSLRV